MSRPYRERLVKLGTMSGQCLRVRFRADRYPKGKRPRREPQVGDYMEVQELTSSRYASWNGPLKIWRISEAPESRLFMDWV